MSSRWDWAVCDKQKQERDPFTDLRRLLQSSDLTLTGMLSYLVRLNHIKRETSMTWRVTLTDRIILFLNSVKERDLMHPFWGNVFSGYTRFEEKFSLDAPILEKIFSGYTHFENFFSGCTHFECTWEIGTQSPQFPEQQQQEEEEQNFPLPDLSALPQIKTRLFTLEKPVCKIIGFVGRREMSPLFYKLNGISFIEAGYAKRNSNMSQYDLISISFQLVDPFKLLRSRERESAVGERSVGNNPAGEILPANEKTPLENANKNSCTQLDVGAKIPTRVLPMCSPPKKKAPKTKKTLLPLSTLTLQSFTRILLGE